MENPAHVSTTGFQMSVEGSHNQTGYGCARGKSHGASSLSVESSLSKNIQNCVPLSVVKSDYKYKDLLSQDGDHLTSLQDIVISNTNTAILDGDSTELPFESLPQTMDIQSEPTIPHERIEEKENPNSLICDSVTSIDSNKNFDKDLNQSVKSVVLGGLSTIPVICVGSSSDCSGVSSLPVVTVQMENVKSKECAKMDVLESVASSTLNLGVDELLTSNAFQVSITQQDSTDCTQTDHLSNSVPTSAICVTSSSKSIPVSTVDLTAGFESVGLTELGFISYNSLKDVSNLVSSKSSTTVDVASLLTSVPVMVKEEDIRLLVDATSVPTSPGDSLSTTCVDPVLHIPPETIKNEINKNKRKSETLLENFVQLCQEKGNKNDCKELETVELQNDPGVDILMADAEILTDKSLIFQHSDDSKIVDETELQCAGSIVVEEVPLTTKGSHPPEIIINEVGTVQAEQSDVASISFATDKVNQTMQILVNTSQGQQIFEMNTANTPLGSLAVSGSLSVESCNLQSLLKGATIMPTSQIPNTVVLQKQSTSTKIGEESVNNVESGEIIEEDEVDEVQCDETAAQNLTEFVNKLSSCGRNKKKTWPCPVVGCNQIYDRECKLRVHLINHSEKRTFKCYVAGCDWAFTTSYRLRRHLETHIGKKEYVCDIEGCNCKFTTIYNLNTHKKRHRRPNSVICTAEGCGAGFPTRRKMELHLRIHKEVDAPYKCSICNKEYYSANAIASHLRIHQHNEDDFKCPFQGCGKIFDKICRLKQHVICHTGDRPYACDVDDCGWRFITASKLARHMRKHTGERRFTCTEPGCGKSFMRPEHLKGHVITHSGDKPFECPHENCHARFNAKSSLYVHLKKHNGTVNNTGIHNKGTDSATVVKLVYTCPVAPCNKKFSRKESLKLHLQNRHLSVLDGQQICVPLVYSKEGQNVSSKISISVVNTTDSDTNIETEESIVVTPDFLSECETDNSTTCLVLNPDKSTSVSTAGIFPATIQTLSPSAKVMSPSDLELLTSSRLLQENNSGSARTDFCSNHILSTRTKKWWMIQQQPKASLLSGDGTSHETGSISQDSSQTGIVLRSSDVMLASSIAFPEQSAGEHFVQAHFLHDDPSASSNIYQEDNILAPVNSSFVSELSIPVSLLSDQSDAEGLVIEPATSAADFPSGTSEDVEFAGADINLEGLE